QAGQSQAGQSKPAKAKPAKANGTQMMTARNKDVTYGRKTKREMRKSEICRQQSDQRRHAD
ncbi:hypothetical protein KUCAC02_033523, partial [Chaenocephalus aceratus]